MTSASSDARIRVTRDGSDLAVVSAEMLKANADPDCPKCHGEGTTGQLVVPKAGIVRLGTAGSIRVSRGTEAGPHVLCSCTHVRGRVLSLL